MKIGVLTFHRSQNFGALLQAYGLQTYIESLGHHVFMVDYWPEYHRNMYKVFSWKIFCMTRWTAKPRYLLYAIGTIVRTLKRKKKTIEFVNRFLHLSDELEYDVVIYGSDQIWRKYYKNNWGYYNPVYWGENYVETQIKIAYAASMGQIQVSENKDRDFIDSHLKNFNAISIREQDLIDYMKEEFGQQYKLVCDPVFLLRKVQWETMVNKNVIPSNKYILYYRLQNIELTDDLAEQLSSQTGLPIIETRGYIPLFHYNKRYRFTISAQEFVSLIYGAEYVVTSAFHGVAMSIIFNKQFYYGSGKKESNRVMSLANKLGLESRIITSSDNTLDINKEIDYMVVNTKLDNWSNDSREWLDTQLRKMDNYE